MTIKSFVRHNIPIIYDLYLDRLIRKSQAESRRIHDLSDAELESCAADMYRRHMGRTLDWGNLQSFTEKMQWAKIYDNDPRKVTFTDKFLVREHVKLKIGERYLIPLLEVWDRARDIHFDELPEGFVLKTNHASADAIPVRNKSGLYADQKREIIWRMDYANRTDFGTRLLEMHYSKIRPKIIAEELIGIGEPDLLDYKFQCFDGKPVFCFVDSNRAVNHHRNVYDMDWKLLAWNTGPYENAPEPINRPAHFDEMIRIAEILSDDFPQVRIDLYNLSGTIYFGEMTFTAAAGLNRYSSYEADLALGQMWNADTKTRCRIDR